MSRTQGEGRSLAEKAARLLVTPEERKRRREAREAQEAAWAARSGAVTTRRTDAANER